MVTTRAGAARARTAPLQHTQASPTPSPATSPTPSLIQTNDGQNYDVSSFGEDLRRRAKRGLLDDNEISVKLCKEIGDTTKRYIFYLDDDITVAVDKKTPPKCSCGANEGGKACKVSFLVYVAVQAPTNATWKHLFWILGQLPLDDRDPHPLSLAEDGSSLQDKHPAEIIENRTLEEVAKTRGWLCQDDQLPEQDEMVELIVRTLSVYDPSGALPGESKSNETLDLPDSRRYREFVDLISQHAIKYPAFFIQLQSKIPVDFQVEVFFDKINRRIDRAFAAFHEYIARGPTNTQSEALDVKLCAARLRQLVDAVHDYYHEEVGAGTDDNNIGVRVAAALERILGGVTDHSYDVYERIAWGAIPPTDPEDRNLLICLIGTSTEEQMFVLDTLATLPEDDVLRNYEHLYEVEQKLRDDPFTPLMYTERLHTLIHETGNRKRAASESGGSSAKRPVHTQ